ncbi:MAG: hypothetical protein J0H14_05500 [Alphaproteobacteria bacterium]|nr:hypothetical protein [Alphaproteobacteria bacterium]
MTTPDSLRTELESLAGYLEEPFHRAEGVAKLLADPAAQRLLAGGDTTARELLGFLRQSPDPAAARVAVLLATASGSDSAYGELLDILGGADRRLVLAFDTGLWRAPRGEDAIARDIVRVVENSGNPEPLILLQRPRAAAAVKPRLRDLVRSRIIRFAEYAMSALASAVTADDIPFLTETADGTDRPGLSSEAGIALLRLGSRAGWRGIEAGLAANDEERRVTTFAALRPLLPEELQHNPGFDPHAPTGSQPDALARLRNAWD